MTFNGAAGRHRSDARYGRRSVEWYTPQPLFDALDREFMFTLDAAATAASAKCARYFTAVDDGLARSWAGERVWLNPPYGGGMALWMRKAHDSARDEGALVVGLVPAYTDSAWWHDHALAAEIRFIRGRVKFLRPNGEPAARPVFGSAVVIWRPGLPPAPPCQTWDWRQ